VDRSADGHVTAGPLSDLLPSSAIRIGASAADWRAAVRIAGDALVASGATSDGYTDEMIRTVESLGPYIVIAPGVALAHARPSPAVLHAGLSLITLATPVPFGHRRNDPVWLVIGLAAPDANGHVDALATLAEFIADDDRRDALMRTADASAVRSLIAAYEAPARAAS
jgi:PTS system ascorbate-specific IIA component